MTRVVQRFMTCTCNHNELGSWCSVTSVELRVRTTSELGAQIRSAYISEEKEALKGTQYNTQLSTLLYFSPSLLLDRQSVFPYHISAGFGTNVGC